LLTTEEPGRASLDGQPTAGVATYAFFEPNTVVTC
jgi:hypothetical protein